MVGNEKGGVNNMNEGIDTKDISRRDFLKLSAAAGVSAAGAMYGLSTFGVTGNEFSPLEMAEGPEVAVGSNEKIVRSSCGPNCWQTCPHAVTVRDGKIVNITAQPMIDPEYTRICLKGLTNIQRVYHPDRLKYPMMRVGERGSGQWRRIGWDEALDIITERMTLIKSKYGAEAISWEVGSGNYGWLTGYGGWIKFILANGGTLPLPFGIDMAEFIGVGYTLGGMLGSAGMLSGLYPMLLDSLLPGELPQSIANGITSLMGLVQLLLGATIGPFLQPLVNTSMDLLAGMGLLKEGSLRGTLNLSLINGVEPAEWKDARCMLVWGCSMSESRIHDSHFLSDAVDNGCKVIVVDPRFTTIASKADLWVPIKPGSDMFFGLAMIHTIIEEGLYDEEFVKEKTCGPLLVKESDGKYLRLIELPLLPGLGTLMERDGLTGLIGPAGTAARPTLFGEYSTLSGKCKPAFQLLADLAAENTPEKVEGLVGVPAETIREAARMFAQNTPGGIEIGLGPDRYTTGDSVGHLMATVLAVTGNIGKPGNTGLGINLAVAANFMGNPLGLFEWLIPYGLNAPSLSRLGDVLTGIKMVPMLEAPDHVREGEKKMLYSTFSNFIGNQAPERLAWINSLHEADKHEDGILVVTVDLYMTPTCEVSDLVLPCTHYYETDDMVLGLHPYLVKRNKAIEPLWEAKSDWHIYCALAEKLGFSTWFDPNVENNLRQILGDDGYEDITANGMIRRAVKPYIPEFGVQNTDSGRLHFYNDTLVDVNHELPYAVWPVEAGPDSPEARDYPIVFNQQHCRWRVHSTFNYSPWTRQIIPEPLAEMNTEDAKTRGISEGDKVKVWNDRGYAVLKARVTEAIQPGGLNIQQGWYAEDYYAGHHQNMTHRKYNPMTYNASFFDTRVNFKKVTEAEIADLQRQDAEITPYIEKKRLRKV